MTSLVASSTLVLLVLTKAGTTDAGFPLAAAFVTSNGALLVVQGDGGSVELPTQPGKRFLDADLSNDGRTVVATTVPVNGDEEVSAIFSYDLRSAAAEWSPLATTLPGSKSRPRFVPGKNELQFAGHERAGVGGPHNRTQVYRLATNAASSREAPTVRLSEPNACYFSTAPTGTSSFIGIKTNCYFSPNLVRASRLSDGGITETALGPASKDDEFAVSPDGSMTIRFERLDGELRISTTGAGSNYKELLRLPYRRSTVNQPRFICPRHVLFYLDNAILNLDVSTAKVETAKLLQPDSRPEFP